MDMNISIEKMQLLFGRLFGRHDGICNLIVIQDIVDLQQKPISKKMSAWHFGFGASTLVIDMKNW